MTAGNEEHEPLISTSVDNQRVTYNNSPQVTYNIYLEFILIARVLVTTSKNNIFNYFCHSF